jgi:glyoxylase-like metal-dependent hydrolase (beta-lactamase superfamily II)
MLLAPEFHRLSHRFALWQAFDPAVKTDLYSTAALAGDALFLIDPIPLDPAAFQELRHGHRIGGILVSNANHLRASADFGRLCQAPIHCAAEIADQFRELQVLRLRDGSELAAGITSIELKGAAPGEFAFHFVEDGGAIVVGDALINIEPYGFALLPAKYCDNQKELKRSLQKLLHWPFERLLFAHGAPILSRTRECLENLLR